MTTNFSYVPELEHFRARLDRAARLYENINTAWESYLHGHPHRLVTRMHPDGRGELLVERTIALPPEPMLLLGEFAYQLRAALENCLYAVAIIASGANPPPGAGSLQWPICDDPEAFARQRSRLKHLPKHLVDCLELIQPYRAEMPAWNSLRLLNELARVDRHRALHDIALVVVDSHIVTDDTVIKNVKLNTGALFDGSALVTFEYNGPGQPTR